MDTHTVPDLQLRTTSPSNKINLQLKNSVKVIDQYTKTLQCIKQTNKKTANFLGPQSCCSSKEGLLQTSFFPHFRKIKHTPLIATIFFTIFLFDGCFFSYHCSMCLTINICRYLDRKVLYGVLNFKLPELPKHNNYYYCNRTFL